MAVHGDDFVCLSDDDGFKNIDSLLKSKNTAEDMGTLGFEDSDVQSVCLELDLAKLDNFSALNPT